ncbi:MAG: FAD-dependent oxidoreductase, partial [bacterium]|nr:FAD-dependent oxidoreductase [bacterium]
MVLKNRTFFTLIICLLILMGSGWGADSKKIVHRKQSSAYDTIIVGGGIAGLSCAYYLRNQSIVLLEKEDRVGGRTLSGTHEGFTYAKGTEYLGDPEDYLATIINALNLTKVEIPEPMDAHYYNQWFYTGYDEIEEMLVEYSSQSEYNRFVQLLTDLYDEYEDIPDLNLNTSLANLDTVSARQWFLDNNFSAIYREVYNVSSRGLFGATIDEISALSFIPEMAFDFIDDDIDKRKRYKKKSILSHQTNRPRPQAVEGSGSYTFVTGVTEVTDAIAANLGSNIRLNATVSSVTLQNGIYAVSYENSGGSVVTLYAKTVVLAVPASVALQIAPNVLSSEQKS